MKKLGSCLAIVFSAACACAAGGDIYDIRPCDQTGQVVASPVATINAPLGTGVPVYFRVRFVLPNGKADANQGAYYALDHIGHDSEILDDVDPARRLKIGIYVSGRLEYATLVNTGVPQKSGVRYPEFYDLWFRYDTKAGDFALPIRLATASGPANDVYSTSAEYLLANSDKWALRYYSNTATNLATWVFNSTTPAGVTNFDGSPVKDYALTKCGFHIQTVDFLDRLDPEKWEETGVWRTVPETDTILGTLKATAQVDEEVTLYVWSTDESAVRVVSDSKVKLISGASGGSPVYGPGETSVGQVTISGGNAMANFTIEGCGRGKTANLVLSAWTNYTWSSSSATTIVDYVTVPVRCVEPPPPSISVTPVPAELERVTVTSDFKTPVAQLNLALSQAYTNDDTVKVTITPRISNAPAGMKPWNEYVRLSLGSDATAWTQDGPLTVEFSQSSALNQTIYVYGLGADNNTSLAGHEVFFEVTSVEPAAAADFFSTLKRAVLSLDPAKPVVVNPPANTGYEAAGGVEREFEIQIEDNYQNLADTGTCYRIYWKQGATDGKYTVLKDGDEEIRWAPDGDGFLKRLNEDGTLSEELPTVTYVLPGTYATSFYVLAPNGQKSEYVPLTVEVSKPPIVSATITNLPEDELYVEGDIVKFSVQLTHAYGSATPIYAFLKPIDDVSGRSAATNTATGARCVIGSAASSGVRIGGSSTSSGTVVGTFKVTDGTVDGSVLEYELKLCTSQSWDPANEIVSYASENLQVIVKNVTPSVKQVKMNNVSPVTTSGETMKRTAAKGVAKTFNITVDEPGDVDKESTGDDAFAIQWTVEEANGASRTEVISGNPNGASFNYTFNAPGLAKVTLELMDKDMRADTGEYTEPFEFYVEVTGQPTIQVESDRGDYFYENLVGVKNTEMRLALSENSATDPLAVQLMVYPVDPTAANPGRISIGGLGNAELSVDGITNIYRGVVAAGVTSLRIWIDDADGTKTSGTKGFWLKAAVLTETTNPDGVRWCDYYLSDPTQILVQNVEPTVVCSLGSPNAESNAFPAAIGAGDAISYSVGDVDIDLVQGLTAVWTADGVTAPPVTITDEATYTYTPVFSSAGIKTVKLVVTDKDKDSGYGTVTMQWYFKIETSKTLTTIPHGPNGGQSTSARSVHYNSARGLGEGHVFARGSYAGVNDFRMDWNVGLDASVEVYGFGYRTNAVENGWLDSTTQFARDISINTTGNKTMGPGEVEPDPYVYSDPDGRDSFFYAWIQSIAGDSKSSSSASGGGKSGDSDVVIAPEHPLAGAALGTILLPGDADSKSGSYPVTYAEAIFAKEYLPSDECGDINADGIPDVYVALWKFGLIADDGALSGDDLTVLTDFNDDADYLPNTATAVFADWVPGLAGTWVTIGLPFTAELEIRGYGEALNDATAAKFPDGAENPCAVANVKPNKRYTDPDADAASTLSPLEWAAYSNYCAVAGLDIADEANWERWSPERPTDPTKADTDGDGLPDGLEYYIWYAAHVGYFENGVYRRLEGRKYDPANPAVPVILTADELEKIYDPIVKNVELATTDTDNDGLPDLVEFELGTNPFDFDTDRDGLPDGYEISITGTDPLLYSTENDGFSDGDRNPDKDFFAFTEISGMNALPRVGADGRTNSWFVASGEFTLEENIDGDVTNVIVTAVDGKVYEGWLYGVHGRICRGRELKPAAVISNAVAVAVGSTNKASVCVMHWDVFRDYPFDPRTGWNDVKNCPYGHAVKTKEFSNEDEFLVSAWYIRKGALEASAMAASREMPLETLWAKYSTNPNNADTDGDGIPDGWELYVQAGPFAIDDGAPSGFRTDAFGNVSAVAQDAAGVSEGPLSLYGPLNAGGAGLDVATSDDPNFMTFDGLTFAQEYSGIESCAVYAECETIKCLMPEWKNKIWPTNPWRADTDGDGLLDGDEGRWFVYGTNEHVRADWWDVVEGGGLNPCSWDTDDDGLPDAWEAEFAGGWVKTTVTVESKEWSSDETGNVSTNVTGESSSTTEWEIGMNGTLNDSMLDYDNDGLLNWQEYMVGAMRCWRYDDMISSWESMHLKNADVLADDDDWWYETLLDITSPNFNQGLCNEHFSPGNYFSCATNAYERGSAGLPGLAYKKFYMFKDGYYHDLKYETILPEKKGGDHYNRWTRGHDGLMYRVETHYPTKYISCDPRLRDTDGDGMDDFWELFHGLNPLLGSAGASAAPNTGLRDIVHEAWGAGSWDGGCNGWYEGGVKILPRPDKGDLRVKYEGDYLDFFQFPWLAGDVDADPDGDNIRNQQEAILANVQAASTYLHTDPTPLWMTDTSYEDSLTYRYYQISNPGWSEPLFPITVSKDYFEHDGVKYYFKDFPWLGFDSEQMLLMPGFTINYWGTVGNMFSYEENEGYDSDHDFLSDFEEAQGKIKSASDPQDHDSPYRRQAMYFGGKADPGFLQTPIAMDEYSVTGTVTPPREDFLYYTVECWAKPDASDFDSPELQTLVERAFNTGSSGPADEKFLRKNFLIGLKGGRWYTKFDSSGTDANQPVEITDGAAVSTNWTHVAATYDGKALRLYVNGVCCSTKTTTIHPEHGVAALSVSDVGELSNYSYYWTRTSPRWYNSILVGASAVSDLGICFDYSWIMRNQMLFQSPENPYGLAQDTDQVRFQTKIIDYGSFFKGYIDEVRIWDGARSAAEILADYKNRTRYTTETALANREAVYNAWTNGCTRIATVWKPELPAELRFHWAFDHVPGAVDAADVITTPAGYSTDGTMTDAKAVWARPDAWVSPWWSTIDETLRPKVYSSEDYIPWINNTVSHLPRFDKTTVDSVYWSEDFYGDVSVRWSNYDALSFPRTHELPSSWVQQYYSANKLNGGVKTMDTRAKAIAGGNISTASMVNTNELRSAYDFTFRYGQTIGGDILPFGGVYAKRISVLEGGLWDDQGAADAWAENGDDADHNSLPDWWEDYIRENRMTDVEPGVAMTWDQEITYCGLRMPAWEAYVRDLARGLLPDGKIHPEYADTRDVDHDGIPDWWESDMYGVDTQKSTDARADSDYDGLSNYIEYLISVALNRQLNPNKARSGYGQLVPDYFLRQGSLYLGEMFTDHDFVEDWLEDELSANYVNGNTSKENFSRFIYDVDNDADDNGWDNWSEARSRFYEDTWVQFGTDTNLVVYTFDSDSNERILFDATNQTPIALVEYRALYDGNWYNSLYSSIPGVYDKIRYTLIETAPIKGYGGMPLPKVSLGLVYNGERQNMAGKKVIVKAWNRKDLADLEMTAKPDAVWAFDVEGEFHLNQTVTLSQDNLVEGYLRGGLTMFVAYIADVEEKEDKKPDPDKEEEAYPAYKVGMPYGVAGSVEVGYARAEPFTIELTDVNASFVRIDLPATLAKQAAYAAALPVVDPMDVSAEIVAQRAQAKTNCFIDVSTNCTDRGMFEPTFAGLFCPEYIGTNTTWPSLYTRVRVFLSCINGTAIGLTTPLIDRKFHLDEHPVLTEADFVPEGGLDFDWGGAVAAYRAISRSPSLITSVTYSIVFGEDEYDRFRPNNLCAVTFVNRFESGAKQTLATELGVSVKSGRPTFSWKHENTLGKPYPAFRLRLRKGTEVVYDSGDQKAPARDSQNVYHWTAPITAGMMTSLGKTIEPNVDYTWDVSMLDAKFTTPSYASAKMRIQDSVSEGALSDYGQIAVAVKYMGPGKFTSSKTNGAIVVQAFTSPDFTGQPVSQTYVMGLDDAVNAQSLAATDEVRMNAILRGLPKGAVYYVRAFIDSNGDGRRQKWESWGYGNYIGTDRKDYFTPYAYSLASREDDDLVSPTAVVYIEDADTNNNKIPDVWEYDKDGELGGTSTTGVAADSPYVVTIDGNAVSAIFLNANSTGAVYLPFYSTLANIVNGGWISSPSLALAVAGLDLDALVTRSAAQITAFSPADGIRIAVSTESDGVGEAGDLVRVGVRLSLTLQQAENVEGPWKDVKTVTDTFAVNGEGVELEPAKLESLNAALHQAGQDSSTGFYRVKVETSAE